MFQLSFSSYQFWLKLQFLETSEAHRRGAGRADITPRPPYRSDDSAVEMDALSSTLAELPADCINPISPISTGSGFTGRPYRPISLETVPESSAATDPRANLSHLKTDTGRAAYVNHWNQYKALGTGDR